MPSKKEWIKAAEEVLEKEFYSTRTTCAFCKLGVGENECSVNKLCVVTQMSPPINCCEVIEDLNEDPEAIRSYIRTHILEPLKKMDGRGSFFRKKT